MKHTRFSLGLVAAVGMFALLLTVQAQAAEPATNYTPATVDDERLGAAVRHRLVMLPWYGVFDSLEYSIKGDTVILSGQASRPTLKSDAEASLRNLKGVSKVVNNIEVLPLSPNDDRIRRTSYRALFSSAGLDLYARSAVPSIHIVVKNGHITLTGVVDRVADKNYAEIIAESIPGVFSVTNNLKVQKT